MRGTQQRSKTANPVAPLPRHDAMVQADESTIDGDARASDSVAHAIVENPGHLAESKKYWIALNLRK